MVIMLRAYPEDIIKNEKPEIRVQYVPYYVPYTENQNLDKLIVLGMVGIIIIVCLGLILKK